MIDGGRLHQLISTARSITYSGFARAVAATLAVRAVQILTALLLTVIIARLLGPEGRGLYATAAVVGAIGVQLTNFGLHASNTYRIARGGANLGALIGNSIVVSVVIGGGAALVAGVVFAIAPSLAPVSGALLLVGLTAIPIGLAYLLMQGLLLGLQRVRAYNLIELVTRAVGLAIVAALVLGNAITPTTALAATLAASAAGATLAVITLVRAGGVPLSPVLALFREDIGYGLKAYLSALFAFLVLRVDLLMVDSLLGPAQAGFYSIAATMGELLALVPVVAGTILFPRLTATADAAERWRLTQRALVGVTWFMTGIGIVAILLAEPAVRLLFSDEFLPSVAAFQWLVPGVIMIAVNSVLMNYFASIGMPIVTVLAPAAAAVANVGLNFWMIPAFGLVGASLSSVAAYAAMLGSSLLYVRRRL